MMKRYPAAQRKVNLENVLDFAPPMSQNTFESCSSMTSEFDYQPLISWTQLLQLIKDNARDTTLEILLVRRTVGAQRGVQIAGSASGRVRTMTLDLTEPRLVMRVRPAHSDAEWAGFSEHVPVLHRDEMFDDPKVVAFIARLWVERSVMPGLIARGVGL